MEQEAKIKLEDFSYPRKPNQFISWFNSVSENLSREQVYSLREGRDRILKKLHEEASIIYDFFSSNSRLLNSLCELKFSIKNESWDALLVRGEDKIYLEIACAFMSRERRLRNTILNSKGSVSLTSILKEDSKRELSEEHYFPPKSELLDKKICEILGVIRGKLDNGITYMPKTMLFVGYESFAFKYKDEKNLLKKTVREFYAQKSESFVQKNICRLVLVADDASCFMSFCNKRVIKC